MMSYAFMNVLTGFGVSVSIQDPSNELSWRCGESTPCSNHDEVYHAERQNESAGRMKEGLIPERRDVPLPSGI
jgi:hypothetical protein